MCFRNADTQVLGILTKCNHINAECLGEKTVLALVLVLAKLRNYCIDK